jgi:hypothetical protein
MELSEYSNEQLVQMLANARKTYYGALGHGKTYRNEMRMIRIREHLEQIGVTIPNDQQLDDMGQFNGDGSL